MLTFLLLAVLAADELPRRAMLGVYAGAARGGGTEIKGALPNSTASRLGLKAGDVILEVNGSKTPDSEALLNALARFRAGDSLTVTIKRKQSRLTLRGSAVERSREKWPGADVNYGAVPHRGGKLRTILVTPTAVKRPPVVFFIQGVSCYSTEWDDPGMALRQLFQPVVDSGFAVFRVEKLAVGDSEGPMRCRDASFSEELAGFESAYRALLRQPDLGPVYMVGHSMGGIQAPLLAQSVQVPAGVAVYGTVLEPWEEYLTKLFRVQPVIASGSDPAAAARRARLIAPVLRAYLNEDADLEALLKDAPEAAEALYTSAGYRDGKYFMHRAHPYWQELQKAPVTDAWHQLDAPVLVLHGESDLAALDDEGARMIARVVNQARPKTAEFLVFPETNHGMLKVGDEATYRQRRADGSIKKLNKAFNREIARVLVDWLHRQQKSTMARR